MKPSILFFGGLASYFVGVILYAGLMVSIILHWHLATRPLLVAEVAVCIAGSLLFIVSVALMLWRGDAEL